MWAQLVKVKAQPGKEDELQRVGDEWEEQVGRGTDSGWVRTLLLKSTANPDEWYQLVYFESEEKARANERNPKHQELIQRMMPLMAGQPEYVDLTPVQESER